jgi:peptidoglycan hydrolase CwlO-like protein
MADLGRTYQSKRKPSHITAEASRLREMVQDREEEVEQLQKKLREKQEWVAKVVAEKKRLRAEIKGSYAMLDKYANEVSDEAYHEIESCLVSALDGGGEQS